LLCVRKFARKHYVADVWTCCPLAPPPPHVVLMGECDTLITQFAHVPALRETIQQRDELQREFTALNAAKTNFKEIASVGTAYRAAVAAVQLLPLSERDYLTLPDRHAAFVTKMTDAGMEMADAGEFDTVELLGAKLEELKALDVSALPQRSPALFPVPLAVPPPSVRPSQCGTLMGECGTVVDQFAYVPALRDAIQQRDQLQREFAPFNAAGTNFKEIARLGKAAVAAVLQQPLSEEDYLTLADRHAALVQKVTATCTELADAGAFCALTTLAAKLEELKALDVSALPKSSSVRPPASPSVFRASSEPPVYGALAGECDTILTQLAHVPTFRAAIQQRDELQREYDALKSAASDLISLGRVGKALKAAIAAVVLTEEDYLTLADRHAALVQKVTATCAELANAGEFDALDILATKLEELKALDVLWANDPVQPPAVPLIAAEDGEDDSANDPVYVPPAPGTSLGSVATVSHAFKAICVTAEEGEDDGANDPVYVPAGTDETTLA
jgi:cell fate (sporulation/competence/biofilm development) regulator YlbF (YheA/YmcA/DUF963 family)